jgi:hypothetical protein
MLQGASKRSKQVSARELIMIDQLLRYLPNLLDELDMDQKSSVLKYVAQIEMHYHVPSYRVPSVIYDIRQTLMVFAQPPFLDQCRRTLRVRSAQHRLGLPASARVLPQRPH